MDLYRQILPTSGYYCVAEQLEVGFKHHFHNTIDDALLRAKLLDERGATVFLAQASFSTIESRKQSNVEKVKSLWLDLDCGPNKPYPTQADAGAALKGFCQALNIHIPVVVVSGNGLYAHFPINSELKLSTWQGLATLFRKCCETHGLQADHSRTCDGSSVLRPIGATHRKDPLNPKTVRRINQAETYDLLDMIPKMKAYLEANGVPTKEPKKSNLVNAEFSIYDDNIKMNPRTITKKCQQISFVIDNPTQVSEPLWYAAIGMLRYTEDGRAVCHEWSKGHSGYSVEECDRKIDQHINANVSPTTCETFNKHNPGVCELCKHVGKITTPLQLGREVKLEFTPEEPGDELPPAPPGYVITNSGVVRINDDTTTVICPDPIYPIGFRYDMTAGYETTVYKHKTPLNGWQEIKVKSSYIHDPKQFVMALADKSCNIITAERKTFMNYIELFSQQLRKQKEISKVASQQGWCEDDEKFLLGTKLYERNGKITEVGLSDTAPNVANDIKVQGDWRKWSEASALFDKPTMRGHAFGLLAGAFGAPLMKYTGYSGAMLAMVGSSGVGKSLVGQFAVSAYGDPTKLMMLRDDTKNALMSRMGFYNNLPTYVDEVSNIPGDELSELVYRVTQGREKQRLTKNAVERSNTNGWQTITLVSSNHSLIEKLGAAKADASAEINRVFEYELVNSVERLEGTNCYNLFCDNYGGVGVKYVQYLVENEEKHKENVRKIMDMIDKRTNAQSEERFWSALAASAIYGGFIAEKLGLIKFSIAPIIDWVCSVIVDMRSCKKDNVSDMANIVASIIDKFNSNLLIVESYDPKDKLKYKAPIREHRGMLMGRIELGVNRLWFNREIIWNELQGRSLSVKRVESELRNRGILVGRKNVNLARGTCYAVGSVNALEFDLSHPEMGFCRMKLVETFDSKNVKEALKNG